VNISDSVRETIVAELNMGDSVPPDLFDAAVREVASMLRYTIWVDFLHYQSTRRNELVVQGGV